ncbi:MAG TPA: carboxyl transferase domain-containing protein, partial [Ramlibacter sp.]|nr:carboxyl transferase domain-containing protein [Ramlibacter sp.]
GAMAMTAGGFHEPDFIVAWPTGEFGAMGLEGAVKLGYRKELEAAAPGAERDALYQQLVGRQYEAGQALNMAATLEIDAVIDPAATREWLLRGLSSGASRGTPGGNAVDTW